MVGKFRIRKKKKGGKRNAKPGKGKSPWGSVLKASTNDESNERGSRVFIPRGVKQS